ncbi:unnamed protein product [Lepeophtheirus salmonis]|uniref:(salmon louse) hypothetical protein n=1 Tax=Lepeophtheirus salmonis TaxID=72036 RepID=A0A7R8CZI7_LEPSM|nr:unnamed protein product [Lepeophtheirus salmonis]CAF2950448.1 unnamed protein product [Lepeophtheirus salmonis]
MFWISFIESLEHYFALQTRNDEELPPMEQKKRDVNNTLIHPTTGDISKDDQIEISSAIPSEKYFSKDLSVSDTKRENNDFDVPTVEKIMILLKKSLQIFLLFLK